MSSADTTKIIYGSESLPAGCIRLLILHPCEFEDNQPVRCHLRTILLNDEPDYEALSYVWGDHSVTREIEFCGHPWQATVNLESALRSLRFSDKARVLWADALCINQHDIHERGHQVQLMARIYAEARIVRAWMGPLSEAQLPVLEFFRAFRVHQRRTSDSAHGVDKNTLHTSEASSASTYAYGMVGSTPNSSQLDMKVVPISLFLDIVYCAWWRRLWTLQEAVLAKELIFMFRQVPNPGGFSS